MGVVCDQLLPHIFQVNSRGKRMVSSRESTGNHVVVESAEAESLSVEFDKAALLLSWI